jgi:hypothetical protein
MNSWYFTFSSKHGCNAFLRSAYVPKAFRLIRWRHDDRFHRCCDQAESNAVSPQVAFLEIYAEIFGAGLPHSSIRHPEIQTDF